MPTNPSIPSSESPGASNTLGGPISGVVPGSTQAGDVAFGGDARDCEPGMPHYRIDALLVSLRIVLPEAGDEELEALMKKWRAGQRHHVRNEEAQD